MSRVAQGALTWGSVGALVALLVPVVAAAVVWRWQAHERGIAQQAHDDDAAAVRAAALETLTWASVDYRKADTYFSSVERGATGLFLHQFKASVPATKRLLAQNRSVQVPTIPKDGAALAERKGASADVLIAMDATVTNKSTTRPQPRQYRLKVHLDRVGGRWLTSGLEFVDAG